MTAVSLSSICVPAMRNPMLHQARNDLRCYFLLHVKQCCSCNRHCGVLLEIKKWTSPSIAQELR